MTDTVRVPSAADLLAEIVAASRVGYGNAPVTRSKRVNYPASLFHRARAMLAASHQGDGDWITHDGGPNPVPGKMVDAELGCGVFVNCLSDLMTMFWPDGGRYRVTEGVKP